MSLYVSFSLTDKMGITRSGDVIFTDADVAFPLTIENLSAIKQAIQKESGYVGSNVIILFVMPLAKEN